MFNFLEFYHFIIILVFVSCEERVRDNPFDIRGILEPWEWSPINLQVYRSSINTVIFTWDQNNLNIEGFYIYREKNQSGSIENKLLSLVETDIREHIDSNALFSDDITYTYLIYAFAGKNQSSSRKITLNE